MARDLKQVRFNLDLNKPEERAIYEAYEEMRKAREWQPSAIQAFKIYLWLKFWNDPMPLYAAFPHLMQGMNMQSFAPPQYDGSRFDIGETSEEDIDDNLENTFGDLFGDE